MRYINHDTCAIDDEKLAELVIEFGYEGYGLFWAILEKLGKQEKPVKTAVLKAQLNVGKKLEKCWKFLESIGLICSSDGETFNEQLLNYAGKYKVSSEKNAKRVAEWRERQRDTENVTRTEHVRNASKVNKSKVNKSKVNTLSATADLGAEKGADLEAESEERKKNSAQKKKDEKHSNQETTRSNDSSNLPPARPLSDDQQESGFLGDNPDRRGGRQVTPHWKAIVSEWHRFYAQQKNGAVPSFDGEPASSLKKLMAKLRTRVESHPATEGYEWTEGFAVDWSRKFLIKAWNIPWHRDNFLLQNLNSKFDAIVDSNGKSTARNQQANTGGSVDLGSTFAKVDALYSDTLPG